MDRLRSNWHSVHAKILRTILVSFLAGISVAGTILLVVITTTARSNMIDGLSVTGKIIADRSAASLVFFDAQSATDNLSTAKNRQNIETMCLYDAKGNLFADFYHSDTRAFGCEKTVDPEHASNIVDLGAHISISVPVVEHGEFLGHLLLFANTRTLVSNQWFFSIVLAVALLASLLIAYVMGGRLVRHSLKPLHALHETSIHISENPLSDQRVQKISDDEVGRLVDVFNAMLDNLAKENRALLTSENRFRSLCENAPIGVFLKNERGEYEYTNARWAEISGLDDVTATAYASFIEKTDRNNYHNMIGGSLRASRAGVLEYGFQNPVLGKRVLMEYVCPVENEHGQNCLIGSLLDVTELKTAQSELEKLAFYDPLTQLPNRRFFRDHLNLAMAHAQKEGKKLAVYMTDLDDFKKVNDSLGHDVGDTLLVDISRRLQAALSEGDVVSRMGGDEFMVLLDDIDDPVRLDSTSKRILEALNATAISGGQVIQVSGSIGIAIYPSDAQTSDELMRYADMALYDAKACGGNQIAYYSQELDLKIKEKVRMEQKLRQALDRDLLDVYIQPQYAVSQGKIYWGEALVRWLDPEEGFISPEYFVGIAEDAGLIFQLGDFVTERVIRLLSEEGERLENLGIHGISINLSAKQFFSPDFVKSIDQLLKRYHVPSSKVEFELTETTVMDDVDLAIEVMEGLRKLGCQLSIDDFGTGYSSLSYLKRFPITSLKIDRSFICDIPGDQNDVEISCAIIALAHSLGLYVVAEGVETEVQKDFLADHACDFLQGYLLDKPMPIEELLSRAPPPTKHGIR